MERTNDSSKPLRADARRNRKQLLDVAREVFAEEGLDASLEEIARRARVGIGTLYRHFPSRYDLVESIYAEKIEELFALAESLTETEEPGEALFGWLRAEAEHIVNNRPLKIFLMDRPRGMGASSHEWKKRLREVGGTLLEAAQKAGAVRRTITAAGLLQLLHGVIIAAEGTDDAGGHLDDFLEVVFDGLKAQQTGHRHSGSGGSRS